MLKIQPIRVVYTVYETDKFEILRAILDYIQKWEELSNLEKPVFDVSLLYPRKNGLRRKSKVGIGIKDISF